MPFSPYIETLRLLVTAGDMTKSQLLEAYEQTLLAGDAAFVLNAFHPELRSAQFERHYAATMRLLAQEDAAKAKAEPVAEPVAETTAADTTVKPAATRTATPKPAAPAPAPAKPKMTLDEKRKAALSRIAMDRIGAEDDDGKLPPYYCITNHQGVLLGCLTRAGVEVFHEAAWNSPILRLYVGGLLANMPAASRPQDTVDRYLSHAQDWDLYRSAIAAAEGHRNNPI